MASPFKHLAKFLYLCLLAAVYQNSFADSPFFSTLSVRDGLPSNIISGVAQDQHNFMWIGTANGVCRYDGYRFITFKKGEGINTLSANEVSSMVVEGDYLWVGTWKGLCKINTSTFEVTRIDLGKNIVVRTLYKGSNGILWVGTAAGLVRYILADGTYTIYTAQTNHLSHNTVRSIYEDARGNLWVGTYDKLNKLARGKQHFTTFDLKGNYKPELKNNLICGDIKPASSASDSLLWIGTETGLCLFNTYTYQVEHFTEKQIPFSNEVIKCIYPDDRGNLWLGTDFGLNVFNPKTKTNTAYFHHPQQSYSIANNVIWQIFEDSGGVIWFVTSNGLSRLNKFRNFYTYHEVSYPINNQTIGNQVKAVLVTRKGILWLATLHGVIRFDPVHNTRKIFESGSPENNRIQLNNAFALEEDDYGRIWIGTAGGINIWDEAKQKMHAISANATNGLTSNYIARFTKGTDGSFWVSAWEGGLFKVVGNLQELSSIHFELAGDFGSSKNVSGANAIWATQYSELFRIDLSSHKNTSIEAFNIACGKRDVNCLYFSRRGSLWAGVANGLIEYKPQTDAAVFYPVTTGNDITLASITEDRDGNIWCAASNFILKFTVPDHQVEIFPLEKDIPLKSFFDGCVTNTPEGDVIFGGDNGYITLSPAVKPNTFKPHVYITALEINNKMVHTKEEINGKALLQNDISVTNDLTLDYAQRSIAFEFSSLHYWQPSSNVYAYKLDGFDQDWNYVSGLKNFAVYSNLSPGNYTLTVKGTNNYGIWSDQVATIRIRVKPPLFLSNGFIGLYIVIIIAVIIISLRTYTARLHLRNELTITRMEKVHAEEIVQTKQQFFANISHELRTPISLILPPIQQLLKRQDIPDENKRLLTLAEKNSQRLLRVVNQILDFRKLENDSLQLKITSFDLVGFCQELYSLFTDKANRKDIHFTFHAGIEECLVWADTEKIETILFNLLSNAFKFTPKGGHVDLTIELLGKHDAYAQGAIEVKVTDTGIGMSQEEQVRVFERFYQTDAAQKMEAGSGIGLTLVAEYAKLHHGEIQVQSVVGHGTCFTLILPLGSQHFPLEATEHAEVKLVATKSQATEEDSKVYRYGLDTGKPLVLIIEDNIDIIEFIQVSLKHKYHFITAQNGEEGLTKANNFLPDIIISDIMMPVMDGLAMCKQIKSNPKTSHISIVILTAKGLTSQQIEGLSIGADIYLTKPFEIELLEAHIDHLLKRKKELADYFRHELIVQPSAAATGENVDDKFIKKVMSIIEANIANPDLSVEMLSDEVGMSSTHLYRKLKATTQLSPNDIIRKYRIKKASLLLGNKEGNISEIMYAVGFSNLSYFSKCFRAEFGVTPKEYQQKTYKSTEIDPATPPENLHSASAQTPKE
ncbi:MAG TPA: two-component regulator propeller domain-containing protein [Ohtaekwangia sp.]|uniref:hybrid sensor histidine kinase/response regulator transcription factor n=1 Tax=Ohtaekwangia sp. TaxID=2066019 RepID=UPI002F91E7B5